MLTFVRRHPVAFVFSLLVHLTVIVAVLIQWRTTPDAIQVQLQNQASAESIAGQRVAPMKTFAVDATAVQAQIERIKAEEEAKKQEQARLKAEAEKEQARLTEIQKQRKLEKKRAEEAKRLAEAEKRKAEAERRKAAEAKRQADIEKQRVEAEQRRAAAEKAKAEKARREARLAEKQKQQAREQIAKAEAQRKLEEEKRQALEAEIAEKAEEKKKLQEATLQAQLEQERARQEALLEQQLAEEEASRRESQKRQQLLSLKETYVSSIAAKVKDNWRTPARISDQAQCELDITQSPGGKVTSVKVLNCNEFAGEPFKDAAVKAVYRSEPLPEPPVPELFERNIKFVFKP